MSTNSLIGIEYPDGSVRAIYCHWDGYPGRNGRILIEAYTDREKVEELMDLGDLSFLDINLGRKIDFDDAEARKGWSQCLAYGRDRGETNVDARHFENVKEFLNSGEEFNYLFRDGQWYVDTLFLDKAPAFELVANALGR